MSIRYIDIHLGESLVITAVNEPVPTDELTVFLTIGNVKIYANLDKSYVCFTSNLDICNDGSGPAYGDPHHQSQTAYYNNGKFLNADTDKYIVVPPQLRKQLPGIVMGCQAKLTNTASGALSDAVVGDIGPDDKTGEAAYCLAKLCNPSITHNTGDLDLIYFYELWPGIPATVNGKTYKLEPA
jgi:hypothetical protein